ncbi:MAG: sulfotransferase [Proteobacteria bacterium]|nr:sulfotransferase [Pseudomonadota bacterium]
MAEHGDPRFALTGLPRSGTTYLSAVLHDPPHTVTISDPAGVFRRFYRDHGVSPRIVEFFADFRRQILDGEEIPTLEGTPGFAGHRPLDTWSQPKRMRRVDAKPDFRLGLKNPEIFLAHLDLLLRAGIRCVVSVRHPVAVLHSWRQRRGQLADGACPVFQSGRADPVARRIELHNHLLGLILAQRGSADLLVVRYEDWFRDSGLLARVSAFLGLEPEGPLRPAPLAPAPPTLDEDECDRILEGCVLAAELGYPLDGARLAAPSALATPPATGSATT